MKDEISLLPQRSVITKLQINLTTTITSILQPNKFREDILVLGYCTGVIEILNFSTKKIEGELFGHNSSIQELINPYLQYNNMLISSTKQIIKLWDLKTKANLKTIPINNYEIISLFYFPEIKETSFFTSHYQHIREWNIDLCLHKDNQALSFQNESMINLSDSEILNNRREDTIKDNNKNQIYKRHKCDILSVITSPSRKLIITGSSDYDIIVSDYKNNNQIILAEHLKPVIILNNINKDYFASSSEDLSIKIWSYDNLDNSIYTLKVTGLSVNFIVSLSELYNNKLVILTGSKYGEFSIIDLENKKLLYKMNHSNELNKCVLLKDSLNKIQLFTNENDKFDYYTGVYLTNNLSLIFFRLEEETNINDIYNS